MQIASSPLLGGTAFGDQIQLEREAREDGIRRYRADRRKAEERGEAAALPPGQRWLDHWYLPVVMAIRKSQRATARGEKDGYSYRDFAAVMLALPAKKLATITLSIMYSECVKKPNGVTAQHIITEVGRAVAAEAQIAIWNKGGHAEWLKGLFRVQKKYKLTSNRVQRYARATDENAVFDRASTAKIGQRLVRLVQINCCAGDYESLPFQLAFHSKKPGYRKTTIMYMDAKVLDEVRKDHKTLEQLNPVFPPMTVPPFKRSKERGGYTELHTPLVKNATREQRDAIRECTESGQMDPFYECLDALASTPLRVNKPLYAVAKSLYDEGGGVLNVPKKHDHEIPPHPGEDAGEERIKEWKKEASQLHRINKSQLAGLRQQFLYLKTMTEKYQHFPSLWFPPSCDFRQRCYALPMYLNIYGDDLPRGMLEFADAVPCDNVGIRNIAIHAAGLWKHGQLDKLPYDDRVEWTNDHLHDILKSAADPLNYRWWMGAKKPLQFLAACMSMRDKEHAAHYRWGCDGTFNGMQHYAAMARDEGCAKLSNLIDCDEPSVPYQIVADRVVTLLQESDSPYADRIWPHVTADAVKTTTMTQTYGVTPIGAREQVQGFIQGLGFSNEKVGDKSEAFDASMLLANTIEQAIGDLFGPAVALMEYFQEVGRIIAKSGRLVRWNTALGFPVVQPYRNRRSVQISTHFGTLTIRTRNGTPIRVEKQSSACPPNALHSIDSTHLLITAGACRTAGIAFCGVHDGFQTHAQHGHRLQAITQQQFVTLHKHMRPLDTMVAYWRESAPELAIPDPPAPGDFDLDRVIGARYAFS